MEIRIESVSKDNSHSWVIIYHGLNKLVTDLRNNKENDDNEQETSEMQFEDFALTTNVLALRADQRLKRNHEDVPLPAHLQELYQSGKELGLMLSQKNIRLHSVKTTVFSSSSWSYTSRRRWSD